MDIQRLLVKRLILVGLFFSIMLVSPEISLADSTLEKAGGKLVRGFANVTTGWIEVFHEIYEVTMQKDPVTGLLYGSVRGVGMAVIRTGSGLYEIATSPFLFPKSMSHLLSRSLFGRGGVGSVD
jgi:putative exosortase-associated protein (TIGR04073 family)